MVTSLADRNDFKPGFLYFHNLGQAAVELPDKIMGARVSFCVNTVKSCLSYRIETL